MDKETILDEIRRTARENSGTAPGIAKFARETGIKDTGWQKYWVRWSDAVREAGFEPNTTVVLGSSGSDAALIVASLRLGLVATAPAAPAASFLRKEGGLSGRLRIWQSALPMLHEHNRLLKGTEMHLAQARYIQAHLKR